MKIAACQFTEPSASSLGRDATHVSPAVMRNMAMKARLNSRKSSGASSANSDTPAIESVRRQDSGLVRRNWRQGIGKTINRA